MIHTLHHNSHSMQSCSHEIKAVLFYYLQNASCYVDSDLTFDRQDEVQELSQKAWPIICAVVHT